MSADFPDFTGPSETVPWVFLRELGAACDLRSTLNVMAAWVPKFIDVERVSITLVNDDGELDLLAVQGTKISPVGTTFKTEQTLVGRAFTTGKLANYPEITGSTIDGETLVAAGMRSCLVAPLSSVDRCYGTFNVASSQLGYFTADHELVVGALASLVASFARVHFEMEEQQQRARLDSLTGLLNRSGVMAELEERFDNESGQVCVLFLDLDGFKAINDAYGHAVGDKMLIDLSDRIRRSLRPEDALGRIGGDEFVVICDPDGDSSVGITVAERLLGECQQVLEVGPTTINPRLSIGVVVADVAVQTAEQVLTEADLAMYEAKKNKSLIAVANDDMRMRRDLVAAIDRDIAEAMETNEIHFLVQPIWEIETGRLSGAESLVRWTHPVHGPIPPPFLIERIESTEQIEQFTEWSLAAVGRQIVEMRRKNSMLAQVPVSINLTPQQLSWTNYVKIHLEMLERYDLDPQDIPVELVESGVVEVDTSAEATLRALAVENVYIALDDFGTGSNALGYFTRFHIDGIKIDRSLISSMIKSDPIRTIVEGLGSMARALDIQVVAEGIETQAELDLCRSLGVEHGQGFHLGRPMSFDQLAELAPMSARQEPASLHSSE